MVLVDYSKYTLGHQVYGCMAYGITVWIFWTFWSMVICGFVTLVGLLQFFWIFFLTSVLQSSLVNGGYWNLYDWSYALLFYRQILNGFSLKWNNFTFIFYIKCIILSLSSWAIRFSVSESWLIRSGLILMTGSMAYFWFHSFPFYCKGREETGKCVLWLTDCVSWALVQHIKNFSLLLQLLAWPSSSLCLMGRKTQKEFVWKTGKMRMPWCCVLVEFCVKTK